MMFISGAGPPREVIGPTLRGVGDALPLTYAIRLLQDQWFGLTSGTTALWVIIGVIAGSAILSVRYYRWQ
jgi:hypothetical protein